MDQRKRERAEAQRESNPDYRAVRCGHNCEPADCPEKVCGYRDTQRELAESRKAMELSQRRLAAMIEHGWQVIDRFVVGAHVNVRYAVTNGAVYVGHGPTPEAAIDAAIAATEGKRP